MNYSIKILLKEKKQLVDCLSNWDLNHYPDARKERQKRYDDLDECISILRCVNDGINPFSDVASIHCLNLKNPT
jgi:hypothetical protein